MEIRGLELEGFGLGDLELEDFGLDAMYNSSLSSTNEIEMGPREYSFTRNSLPTPKEESPLCPISVV